MKKVIQLSLSLMLILPSATSCTLKTVEPKESKIVEPSTHEFNKIQIAQLPFKTEIWQQKEAVETTASITAKKVEVKKLSAEEVRNAKIERIANKIDTHLEGKLEDKGVVFAESAINNSVDPYLIAAIAIHETGNGTSNAVMKKNNVGGMMGSNGLKRFSSVDDSIETLSALIKNSYVDKGLDTIPEISKRYAPIGADNDPNGLNDDWVSGVRSIYNMLKSTSM